MICFAEVFSDNQILQTLSAKLSWSHFRKFIYFDDFSEILLQKLRTSIEPSHKRLANRGVE